MTRRLGLARGRTRMAVATIASLAVAGLAAGTSYAHASGASAGPPAAHRSSRGSLGPQQPDSYVDVTAPAAPAVASALRAASRVASRPAALAYLAAQPASVVREISGTTGTVRFLADLDGYLTPTSSRSPRS